jgi:hypothetical protein
MRTASSELLPLLPPGHVVADVDAFKGSEKLRAVVQYRNYHRWKITFYGANGKPAAPDSIVKVHFRKERAGENAALADGVKDEQEGERLRQLADSLDEMLKLLI